MALAVDSTLADTAQTATTTRTVSFTNTGGNIIYAIVPFWNNGGSVSSVTYAGTNLTRVVQSALSTGNDRVEIWRLVSPATGANNVVVTLSAGGDFTLGVISFSGADTATPEGTPATQTGSAVAGIRIDLTVTTASGEYIIGGAAFDWNSSGSLTTGASQTDIVANGGTVGGERSASSYKAGSVGSPFSYTTSGNAPYAIGAISVKPAASSIPNKVYQVKQAVNRASTY